MTLKKPKEKGRRAELAFAEILRNSGVDPTARRMVMSGAIFGLEGDIFGKLPIHWEIKNQETWSPLEYYKQAKEDIPIGSHKKAVVVLTRNREDFYCFLSANDFIEILSAALIGGYCKDY